jgi:hypothetical protein
MSDADGSGDASVPTEDDAAASLGGAFSVESLSCAVDRLPEIDSVDPLLGRTLGSLQHPWITQVYSAGT